MAARIQVHLHVNEALDLEPRPTWRPSPGPRASAPELHVPIGPLRLVLAEPVAVALAEELHVLTQGRNRP